MSDHDSRIAWIKVGIAWVGVFFASVTLQQVAFVLTIVFTAFQLYVGLRKLRREIRLERLEAKLKQP